MKRRRLTEADFDLENVRKLARLARRVVRGLEELEKALKVARKRQGKASADAIAIATEMYAECDAAAKRREGGD